MNSFVESEITNLEKRMAGYQYLLNYRYQNLCVKADPASLLPVTVNVTDNDQDIEEVAEVSKIDDFNLAVLPKVTNSIEEINQGVLSAHPEFKMHLKQLDQDDPDTQYIVYEMPEVDKNRYDFLHETVKSLYDECKVRIDEAHSEEKVGFADLLASNPLDLEKTNEEIDKIHKNYLGNIKDLLDTKNKEVEEAYQRWLSEHGDLQGNQGDDVAHQIKMGEQQD